MKDEAATQFNARTIPRHRPLIAVLICFGGLDGALLFLNDQWRPDLVPLLFPIWSVVSGAIAAVYSRPNWKTIFRTDRWSTKWRLAVFALMAGSLLAVALRELGMRRLTVPQATTPMKIGFVLMILLLVPAVEEVLFRGIILDRLLNQKSVIVSILLTSVAAALCHSALIPAFIEQVALGSVYVAGRRSLGASMMAHLSINVVALVSVNLGR